MATVLRAGWVLPVCGPPIENGEVLVEDGRIVEARPVHSASPSADAVVDLGDAVIMPGLVNVHTHLDYTVMRGLLEDIPFFTWIRELTMRKMALTWEDWLASAIMGAAEAVAGGVTTIGDCTDSGAALWGARTLGLRGRIYQEVFGIDELRTVEEIVAELRMKVTRLQTEAGESLLEIGISPHAPYTVRPALMRELAQMARQEHLRVCIHAAESQAEAELLRSGTGGIADMFARRQINWIPPQSSTVAYLDALGIVGANTLLVHGVQVSAGDRQIARERGASWAHCPKSNAKLGNGVAPLGILADFRRDENQSSIVNRQTKVGLGSDSVASNNTMDLFEEMRFAVLMHRGARRRIEAISARDAVEMATIGGARALGLEQQIGTLEPGKRADICAVHLNDLHSLPAYNPYNALVYAARASDVVLTMIDGEIRYNAREGTHWRDRFPHLDLAPAFAQLQSAAQKMRDWKQE